MSGWIETRCISASAVRLSPVLSNRLETGRAAWGKSVVSREGAGSIRRALLMAQPLRCRSDEARIAPSVESPVPTKVAGARNRGSDCFTRRKRPPCVLLLFATGEEHVR